MTAVKVIPAGGGGSQSDGKKKRGRRQNATGKNARSSNRISMGGRESCRSRECEKRKLSPTKTVVGAPMGGLGE